jgi:hypothetical protein
VDDPSGRSKPVGKAHKPFTFDAQQLIEALIKDKQRNKAYDLVTMVRGVCFSSNVQVKDTDDVVRTLSMHPNGTFFDAVQHQTDEVEQSLNLDSDGDFFEDALGELDGSGSPWGYVWSLVMCLACP